ncbi:gas vesicle protein GvpG [Streptomyces nigra]|uniref:gas vesicle protein GvpG n=1 Tax=Streptomyces nigra TaxID=1827580 RepID=UPI0036A5D737
MGLIGEILLLPFAPARGSGWVIKKVMEEAERLYYDPSAVRAELARLEEQLTYGEIDEEEFDRREDELLDRLDTGMRAGYGNGDRTA